MWRAMKDALIWYTACIPIEIRFLLTNAGKQICLALFTKTRACMWCDRMPCLGFAIDRLPSGCQSDFLDDTRWWSYFHTCSPDPRSMLRMFDLNYRRLFKSSLSCMSRMEARLRACVAILMCGSSKCADSNSEVCTWACQVTKIWFNDFACSSRMCEAHCKPSLTSFYSQALSPGSPTYFHFFKWELVCHLEHEANWICAYLEQLRQVLLCSFKGSCYKHIPGLHAPD